MPIPPLDPRVDRALPSFSDIERAAERRLPRIARDYLFGGVGDEVVQRRNRAAFDDCVLTPSYGVEVSRVSTETTVFGRPVPVPFGIAPMGLGGLVWPGADAALAASAERAGIPYVLSTVATTSIEEAARIAPNSLWFQLYGFGDDDHEISKHLIARARDVGAEVLVATLDIPVRARRRREIRNGMVLPFRMTPDLVVDAALHPRWAFEVLRRGRPALASLLAYVEDGDPVGAAVLQRSKRATITWDDLARFRDLWPRKLVVKGLLRPEDAERAVAIGADAVQVSNHGGRQFDASPAALDVLPEIRRAIGGRAAIFFDSGIRSGLDIVRALARGADFVFVGRPCLAAVAALGARGADHATALLDAELRSVLAQMGAPNLAAVTALAARAS